MSKELCRSSIAEIEILDAPTENKPAQKTPPEKALPLVGCSILSVKKRMINHKPCLVIEARLDNRSKQLVCVQQWWLCGRKPSLSVMALPVTDRQGQFVMDLARADDLKPVKGIQINSQGTGRYKLDVARLPPDTAITQIITTGYHIPTGQWRMTLEYDKQLFIRKQDAMQALGDRNSTHQTLFSSDPPEGIVTIKSEPFDFEIP